MVMQPFVNYNFRHGWYLTSSPIVTADWEKQRSQRWVVPVGGGAGKIVKIGALPVNMYAQFFSNVERPQGTTNWSARLQQLLSKEGVWVVGSNHKEPKAHFNPVLSDE
jgi:hypothetical protein